MRTTNSTYIVASVDRALELLILLGRNSRDMGITELSKILGTQKSTVHSLLQTLLARGFVRQSDTGRYTLGFRLIPLGAACAERSDIRTVARPIMAELAEATHEVALLAVFSGKELIIIDKVEPQRPFFIIPKFDFTITMHCTAVGKVLLANAPEEVINDIIENGVQRFTPYTLTDRAALMAEMAKVREQGFAVGCNETFEGVTCIGVPIYGATGEVIAALSISSSSSSLVVQRYTSVIETLRDKADTISERLGFHQV